MKEKVSLSRRDEFPGGEERLLCHFHYKISLFSLASGNRNSDESLGDGKEVS